jgi:hypothetical protein
VPIPHDGVLTFVVKRVFALQIRDHDSTLLVRLVGFHDDEEVSETHVPPLPNIVEASTPPYRRLSPDARNVR